MNDPFGKRLRAARERSGLSQNHFAHRLNLEADTGYNETNVRKWEKGDMYPHARMVPIIADVLGVTIDYLYGRSDDPHGHSDALGGIGK